MKSVRRASLHIRAFPDRGLPAQEAKGPIPIEGDGYSFKSSGSTTRSSTRWKFSYSLCTCSCGSDEYSCLYRYGYKHFIIPINKTSPFSSLFRNRYRNGCFFYVVYLSYWGFRGRPMWGTFWVWDARLTSVLISFLIYLGALCFQKLSVELAPISIRAGSIDIPIIKSSVNWWNTSHQPGSISRSVDEPRRSKASCSLPHLCRIEYAFSDSLWWSTLVLTLLFSGIQTFSSPGLETEDLVVYAMSIPGDL
ncbi:hypothetical protein ACS0TY_017011 [Phlomoides rotata]